MRLASGPCIATLNRQASCRNQPHGPGTELERRKTWVIGSSQGTWWFGLLLATLAACSSGSAQNEGQGNSTGPEVSTGSPSGGTTANVTSGSGGGSSAGTSGGFGGAATSATTASATTASATTASATTATTNASATTATTTNAGGGSASTTQGSSTTGVVDEPEVDARAMVADMGYGANIGNTLENTTEWEIGWGQPRITPAFIDGMAESGIKTVRVPVAWDTYAANGVIGADHLNRVKEVVSWIEAADMYSIVNIHWDGGWIFNEGTPDQFRLTEDVKGRFVSYWTQIASAFSDVGHKLVLEGLNEEGRFFIDGDDTGQADYAALNELNQLFVDTVRAQTGYNQSRALLIAGFATDIELTCVEEFDVPDDPAGGGKLFLSLHYYTPYDFTLMDTVEDWGSPTTTWGDDMDQAELEALFDRAGSFASSRSLPIILGEFAVTRGSNYPRERESRIRWLRSVSEAALSRGMVPVLWDTGSEIDRSDGSVSTEFEEVLTSVGAN